MYKLVISAKLAFTARFIFMEAGEPRTFAAKMEAQRCAGAQLEAALQAKPIFADFLAGQGLSLIAWDGECPLVDEAGQPAPAGPDALAALMQEPGMPNVLFGAYLEANGAKAKLGN